MTKAYFHFAAQDIAAVFLVLVPETRRLIEENAVIFIILDADIDIRLRDKPVLRVIEIIYACMSQRAVSEMIDRRRIFEILRDAVGDQVHLVIDCVEVVNDALDRIGS